MALVESMSDQILPINAEERMETISDHAVAAGCVKKGAANEHMRKLEKSADKKRPATLQDLAGLGIQVVKSG